ncbi:MAG: DUF1343 domain-containing protein [Bacteroidales bacterium]|nr:DUF1343 domain-containing protein [Bacteroidales bacterium]
MAFKNHLLRLVACLVLMGPGLLKSQVMTGAQQTDRYLPILRGKRLAVVANQASVIMNSHGPRAVNLVDTLYRMGLDIDRILSPEHGFRGQTEAGQLVEDEIDAATGIRVISLYGKHKKPLPEDLEDIDLVVFDLQDVGARFFTYLSTLTYVMEACGEKHIPILALDRPNPNGFYIDGPVLKKKYASFIGLHPVPVVYGMTIGEYAQMVNGEGWMKNGIRCLLQIIPLQNYTHHTRVSIMERPSPNLTTMNAILLYPSLCFFEGTTVSVGRGTDHPFEVFGHPGLRTDTFSFVPRSIPGMSLHPPFEGKTCYGKNLKEGAKNENQKEGRIHLLWLLDTFKDLGSDTSFFTPYFDQLAGTDQLRKEIQQGKTEDEIRKSWEPGINEFKKIRKKYLLYPE